MGRDPRYFCRETRESWSLGQVLGTGTGTVSQPDPSTQGLGGRKGLAHLRLQETGTGDGGAPGGWSHEPVPQLCCCCWRPWGLRECCRSPLPPELRAPAQPPGEGMGPAQQILKHACSSLKTNVKKNLTD